MRKFWLMVPVVLLLTACNTLFNKSYQKIAVHTPGVEGVECTLETENNKYVVLTPATVLVDRAAAPLQIICEKVGYYKTVEVLDSKIRMVPAQLNVLNGGVGLPYDVASNSIYAYPETLYITMTPNPDVLVKLPPREVHVLPLKEEVVTPKDVVKAKQGPSEDDDLMDAVMDEEADRAFSRSLRK